MLLKLKGTVREENNWCILHGDNGYIASCNAGGNRIFKELSNKDLTFEDICHICGADDCAEDQDAVSKWVNQMVSDNILNICEKEVNFERGKYLPRPSNNQSALEQMGGLSSPLLAIIDITNKCNQAYSFCYVDPRYICQMDKEVNREQLFVICDRLAEQRVMMLNFLGGEPTARFDDMLAAIDYMHTINPMCHCSFATNGTYNGGINVTQAKELGKREQLSVRISIHGYREDHDCIVGLPGAYDIAIQSLKNLLEYAPNVHPSINITMNRKLLYTYEELIDELFSLGVDLIEFAPIQYSGCALLNGGKDNLSPEEDILIMEKMNTLHDTWIKKGKVVLYGGRYNPKFPAFSLNGRNITCGTGHTIIIDTKGDCYFCHLTVGIQEYCGGNIFTKSLDTIWNSEIHRTLLEIAQTDVPCCENCEKISSCKGGCRISSQLMHGDYLAGDPSCPHIRLRRNMYEN